MRNFFILNACVQLQHPKGGDKTCEIGAEVKSDFIIDFNKFFSEILIYCVKKMGTAKLNLVSIKLMEEDSKIKVSANVLLVEDENKKESEKDKYRKIEFNAENDQIKSEDLLKISRILKYMELEVKMQLNRNLKSLIHVRVVPCEKDDILAKHF